MGARAELRARPHTRTPASDSKAAVNRKLSSRLPSEFKPSLSKCRMGPWDPGTHWSHHRVSHEPTLSYQVHLQNITTEWYGCLTEKMEITAKIINITFCFIFCFCYFYCKKE